MNRIAWMYSKGNGVEKNMDTAKRWWLKAAQHGSILAIGNLEKLEKNVKQ